MKNYMVAYVCTILAYHISYAVTYKSTGTIIMFSQIYAISAVNKSKKVVSCFYFHIKSSR